jgi:hypothetical protein
MTLSPLSNVKTLIENLRCLKTIPLFVIDRKADQSMADPLHGISTYCKLRSTSKDDQHNAEYANREYSNRDPCIAVVSSGPPCPLPRHPEPEFVNFKEPKNLFLGINSSTYVAFGIDSLESIPGLLKSVQIWAL